MGLFSFRAVSMASYEKIERGVSLGIYPEVMAGAMQD